MQGQLAALQHAQSAADAQVLRYQVTSPVAASEAVAERARLLENAEQAAREPLTEAQVRTHLDQMLTEAGWERSGRGRQPQPLRTGRPARQRRRRPRDDHGHRPRRLCPVRGRKLVGVIEAKREGADLSTAEAQADRYADHLTEAQRRRSPGAPHCLSAMYRTAARPGSATPSTPTRAAGESSPSTSPAPWPAWIRQADQDPQAPSFRARLRLRARTGRAPLRPAQIKAILGVEKSVALGKDQQGTGIALPGPDGDRRRQDLHRGHLAYRLLKHGGVRPILFLVDRNNLGDQTLDGVPELPHPGRRPQASPRSTTSTALGAGHARVRQGRDLHHPARLLGAARARTSPTPTTSPDCEDDVPDAPGRPSPTTRDPARDFDLIIVDECHRSIYGAVAAGAGVLRRATSSGSPPRPASRRSASSAEPGREYPYEQSVADGVNVDFDIFRIRTEISEQGATHRGRHDRARARPAHPRQQRYEHSTRTSTYTRQQLDRSVIANDQIRTVLETFRDRLFTELFPGRSDGAEDADLRQGRQPRRGDRPASSARSSARATTSPRRSPTAASANPEELIQAFRNEPNPRIAVTVDMIATGTDVKPLECVIFMRDVRSAQLLRADEGPRRAHHRPRRLPGGHAGRRRPRRASCSSTRSA